MQRYVLMMLCVAACCAGGCKKFLDKKPDKKLAIPTTLGELQLMLQYTGVFNEGNTSVAESFADNYYVAAADYTNFSQDAMREKYIWGDGSFPNTSPSSEWSYIFQQVYIANVVLDALQKMERTDENAAEWDKILGTASFFRAKGWYEAILIWAGPYNASTAAYEKGIPLRTTASFEEKVPRAGLQQSVDAVVADLLTASKYGAIITPYTTTPSRAAAFAMLSRVYLFLGEYKKCQEAAANCLQTEQSLMNYQQYNSAVTYPFDQSNPEVIFFAKAFTDVPANSSRANVDTNLFQSYHDNDLRKTLFFRKNASTGINGFRGHYTGSSAPFIGLAVDEIMLNYAESSARVGEQAKAWETMNKLLEMRYKAGTYQPKSGLTQQETLDWVLTERRKELAYRCLRWADLKRLNQEARYQTTITRIIPGGQVKLLPGDKRYAAVIPEEAIVYGGLQQNPR